MITWPKLVIACGSRKVDFCSILLDSKNICLRQQKNSVMVAKVSGNGLT